LYPSCRDYWKDYVYIKYIKKQGKTSKYAWENLEYAFKLHLKPLITGVPKLNEKEFNKQWHVPQNKSISMYRSVYD